MSIHLYATMKFHDARRAMTLLDALGFREVVVYADDADPNLVHHAEFAWRDSGGLMFGSVGGGDPELDRRAGLGACYLVAADESDVDRAHAAGLAAGATSHEAPNAPAHGGRQCTLRDAEGNLFTIGTYAGADAGAGA